MKLAVALTVLSLGAVGAPPALQAPPAEKPMQLAAMCAKVSERISQMNKICTYRCLSGEVAITIRSTELCPLSIDR